MKIHTESLQGIWPQGVQNYYTDTITPSSTLKAIYPKKISEENKQEEYLKTNTWQSFLRN